MTCNGRKVPLHPTGTEGEYVAGRAVSRMAAAELPAPYNTGGCAAGVRPGRRLDEPLAGGCTYHVGHPGGLNPELFPINAFEAESRRYARFFKMGHSGGPIVPPPEEPNPDFPLTLDLRRNR